MASRALTRRISVIGAFSLVTALAPLALGSESDVATAHEDSDHLASTPPMGWNSWNAFGHPRRGHVPSVNEQVVKEIADRMVETGMRDAGYDYVVVDGGWRAPTRGENGEMRADPEFFPSGMKALGDYIHSRGLKFGIHQAVNTVDCGRASPGTGSAPGDTYTEKAQFDATTFAEWGVDYVKFDWCNAQRLKPPEITLEEWKIQVFTGMRDALDATGRDVVLSINEQVEPRGSWDWGPDVGANMWRTTPDVHPCWVSGRPEGHPRGVVDAIDMNAPLAQFAGPGHWNDPDMLVLGTTREQSPVCTGGLTDTEGRAQFSMWAIMASPLMAGSDLRNDSAETLETLTNQDVIAVDQDPLGAQGKRVRDDGDQEVWVKPMADGSSAVVLFNRGEKTTALSVSAQEELGLPEGPAYRVRDLWAHKTRVSGDRISAAVAPHGVVMYRVWAGLPTH